MLKTIVAMQAARDAPRRSIQRATERPSRPAAATQGIDPRRWSPADVFSSENSVATTPIPSRAGAGRQAVPHIGAYRHRPSAAQPAGGLLLG